MNLDNLVTQDKAEAGEWFPVELYREPCDFDLLILGDDSDTVTRFNREAMKKLKGAVTKDRKGNVSEFDDETIDAMFDSNEEAVLVRIAAIRGWKTERDKKGKVISREPVQEIVLSDKATGKDRVITDDKESLRFLITKIPALKEFVLGKARDRTNFLSGPSGN